MKNQELKIGDRVKIVSVKNTALVKSLINSKGFIEKITDDKTLQYVVKLDENIALLFNDYNLRKI